MRTVDIAQIDAAPCRVLTLVVMAVTAAAPRRAQNEQVQRLAEAGPCGRVAWITTVPQWQVARQVSDIPVIFDESAGCGWG